MAQNKNTLYNLHRNSVAASQVAAVAWIIRQCYFKIKTKGTNN